MLANNTLSTLRCTFVHASSGSLEVCKVSNEHAETGGEDTTYILEQHLLVHRGKQQAGFGSLERGSQGTEHQR